MSSVAGWGEVFFTVDRFEAGHRGAMAGQWLVPWALSGRHFRTLVRFRRGPGGKSRRRQTQKGGGF